MKTIRSEIQRNSQEHREFEVFLSKIFSAVNYKNLVKKAKQIDFEEVTDLNIQKIFESIFLIPKGQFSVSSFLLKEYEFKKSGNLFRVRKLTDELKKQLEGGFINNEELWEPPVEYAFRGRLNYEGYPYLYASEANLRTCLMEAKMQPNDEFILINYEFIDDTKLTGIGFDYDLSLISNINIRKKVELFSELIKRNFLRTQDDAYVYSNYIANDLCNYEKGWAYPSVQVEGWMNVCLTKDEQSKLVVKRVFVCKLKSDEELIFIKSFEFVNNEQKVFDFDSEDFKRICSEAFIEDVEDFSSNDISTDEDKKLIIKLDKFISR